MAASTGGATVHALDGEQERAPVTASLQVVEEFGQDVSV
jgi:hypothetical protein